ncbi:MAG: phosphoribosylglycinamide formyltransferase [Clostridia bacterium]|nr:phosphoribosylglycinamide formyltransferase [Clostridia bacterium]
MIKIAVLVSGGGTNLQALINAQNNGIIKSGKIALVISNNSNAYALERAKTAKIKRAVVSRKEFPNNKDFNAELIRVLKENNIDLVVLAGFLCILSKEFISAFENRIINVHPSLIPSFCGDGYYGLKVHEKALEYGVKVTGATVHFVNEVVDGGKIIMQKAVNVRKRDTALSLQKRVMQQAEWKILPKSVELVCASLKNGEKL